MESGMLRIIGASVFVAALVGSFVASAKGRSASEGFFLGLILGPFGLLIEALLPTLRSQGSPSPTPTRSTFEDEPFDPGQLSKKCPDCAETIKLEARVCRFCQARFDDQAVALALEAARGTHAASTARSPTAGPVVAKCVVCGVPLTEGEVRILIGKSYCDRHFTEKIN